MAPSTPAMAPGSRSTPARPIWIAASTGASAPAVRLRGEFNSLLRLEANYRRGGLTAWERADLDRRFDRLSAQIRYERGDRDHRRG